MFRTLLYARFILNLLRILEKVSRKQKLWLGKLLLLRTMAYNFHRYKFLEKYLLIKILLVRLAKLHNRQIN